MRLHKLIILITILSLSSCDILKQTTKQKKDIVATEEIETKTVRKGDTITFKVPKITYKDTTIVKTNYVNRTEARVRYDDSGNITAVECISAEINELRRELRTITDQSKYKTKDKEESFQSEIVIYVMLGLGVIICGALFIFMWQARKQGDILTAIASKMIP